MNHLLNSNSNTRNWNCAIALPFASTCFSGTSTTATSRSANVATKNIPMFAYTTGDRPQFSMYYGYSTKCGSDNYRLFAECNNVQPTVPYILPPKHLICDPTQSVGVYAPLFPQTLTMPKSVSKPNTLPMPIEKEIIIVDVDNNTNKSKEEEERPFKCSQCSKTFRNKSGLSNHRVIHKKFKPHKCKFKGCGKAFARSCDLTRHTRLHTGVKPYKCKHKDCGRAFTRSVQLRLHMMDHTGLRPHHCGICKKGFKTLRNMQIHMV